MVIHHGHERVVADCEWRPVQKTDSDPLKRNQSFSLQNCAMLRHLQECLCSGHCADVRFWWRGFTAAAEPCLPRWCGWHGQVTCRRACMTQHDINPHPKGGSQSLETFWVSTRIWDMDMLGDLWATDIWISKVFAQNCLRFPKFSANGSMVYPCMHLYSCHSGNTPEKTICSQQHLPSEPFAREFRASLQSNGIFQSLVPGWCCQVQRYLSLWYGEIFSPEPPIYTHLQSENGGFHSHGGTPSHPFLDGIFSNKNHPAIGPHDELEIPIVSLTLEVPNDPRCSNEDMDPVLRERHGPKFWKSWETPM